MASGKEERRPMDPLDVGLEYRVGFTGYCPDQLLSRNNARSEQNKDAIMEAAAGGGGGGGGAESRLHDGDGVSTSGGYGSAMDENCGQPYEDIPAVSIHLHPAQPDTGELDACAFCVFFKV